MIYGEFTEAGQVRVMLTLSGSSGKAVEVAAIVDTGFMGALLLPRSLVSRLQAPQVNQEELRLANGSVIWFSVHEVAVTWHEEERTVYAHASNGDVLVGIELLRGSIGTFEFIAGGTVTLEAAE